MIPYATNPARKSRVRLARSMRAYQSRPLLRRIRDRVLLRALKAPGNSLFRLVSARRAVTGLSLADGYHGSPCALPITMRGRLFRRRYS